MHEMIFNPKKKISVPSQSLICIGRMLVYPDWMVPARYWGAQLRVYWLGVTLCSFLYCHPYFIFQLFFMLVSSFRWPVDECNYRYTYKKNLYMRTAQTMGFHIYGSLINFKGSFCTCTHTQGFLKVTKSCSHYSKILLTTSDIKSRLYNNRK